MKQVSAALRGDREMRRARDINFRCRGVMMLGTAYPVLAVHDSDQWRRKIEPSVGDVVFNETADYRVSVSTSTDVEVFTSAPESVNKSPEGEKSTFTANDLRHFAIVAGRGLRSDKLSLATLLCAQSFYRNTRQSVNVFWRPVPTLCGSLVNDLAHCHSAQ